MMCPTSILQIEFLIARWRWDLETIKMFIKMPGFKYSIKAHHLHSEVTYKMCIRVNANETSDGTDTHVSKKNDDELPMGATVHKGYRHTAQPSYYIK